MSKALCTQDEFSCFFLTTAYDVLGDVGVSRHLKAKSARGEEWALLLSEQHSTTAEILKELIGSVKAKWGEGDRPLTDIVNHEQPLPPKHAPNRENTLCHHRCHV